MLQTVHRQVRLDKVLKVAQEVVIYEGLLHLALKERLHDSRKELCVSLRQEEV